MSMRRDHSLFNRKQGTAHATGVLLLSRTVLDCGCLLLALFFGLLIQASPVSHTFDQSLTSFPARAQVLRFLTLFSLHAAILLSQLQARTRTLPQLAGATVVGYVSVLSLMGLLGVQPLFLPSLFVAVLAAFLLLTFSAALNRRPTGGFLQTALQQHIIVLGTKRTAPLLASHLTTQQAGHLQVVLTVDAEEMLQGEQRTIFESWLLVAARQHFADEIALCGLHPESTEIAITAARRHGLAIRVVPDLFSADGAHPATEFLGHLPTFCLNQRRSSLTAVMAKRFLDVFCAGLAVIVLLPFCLLLLILIKLDSPGPVLYRSQRVGRKGRIFWCWKFRTMVPNADLLKQSLQHMNERDGILFKITNDPRITRVGRHLRKYSLDELPQFLNVLKGDMSLVGPRPPLAEEVAQYDAEQRLRLAVNPGITGLWQVEARANPSFDRYMELDLRYVREWNLKLDLQILLRTVHVVIAGTGQ